MMRICRKIAIWLTVCMMVFVYAPYTVLASTDIDQQKDVSLTIEYVHDTTPVGGVEFEIFFVAEVHGYGKYELAGDFEKYPVQLEEMDTAKWRALARTLIYYVQEDKIQPTDRGVTDAEGRLTFPSEGLSMKPGLYLVNAEPVKGEQYTYYTEPLLVSLPGIDQETDEWEYDVTVNPKFEAEENEKIPIDSTFNQQVMKIWEEDVKEVRPEEVTIKLLENGNLYDSVILNDENNWSYEWQNIPKYDENGVKIDWGIIEEEVADYTVTISKERDMYIVTNTYATGIQTGDTLNKEVVKVWDDKGNEKKRPDEIEISLLKNGEIYDTQAIDSTDDWKFEWENLPSTDSEGNEIDWSVQEKAVDGYRPSIVEKGNVIIITNSLIRPTLPQTGLLWWPVPVLILAGLIFLIAGKVIYGTNKK